MKYVLTLFAILLILEPKVYAKDDKWFDGIRFSIGVGKQNLRIGNTPNDSRNKKLLIVTSQHLGHGEFPLFPVTITFPESLMTSWSFRGAFFQYNNANNITDLAPNEELSLKHAYWRQNEDNRNYLVNDFFTDEDKDYINGKDKWALSADTKLQQIALGYYWGIFFTSWE